MPSKQRPIWVETMRNHVKDFPDLKKPLGLHRFFTHYGDKGLEHLPCISTTAVTNDHKHSELAERRMAATGVSGGRGRERWVKWFKASVM